MSEFVGLPGVTGGKLTGVCVPATLAKFKRAMLTERVCSAAGDNGAITVWCDDDGKWRCERSRYGATQSSLECDTKGQVWAWLRKNLPKIK